MKSDHGQEMILFNNKEILVGNRPIFLKSWFEEGIVSIQDVLSENGKFLSFQEFQETYKIKCNFLNYYQNHICNSETSTRKSKTCSIKQDTFS